ncbi:MAG: hypothetical protein J0I26_03685 [Alphaproteobacteria bacterium]|nr:hypothetical protein [Alphaproteobacteria bacterium]
MEFEKYELTKKAVVRAEIDCAINLFFQGSPENKAAVAANVLAWAAVDVLRGIADKNGTKTVRSIIEDKIKPDYVAYWRTLERESYTFSKHADRDSNGVVNFRPEAVAFALFYAVMDYGTVYMKCTMPMHIYRSWFTTRYSGILQISGEDRERALQSLFAMDAASDFWSSVQSGRVVCELWKEHAGEMRSMLPDTLLRQLEQ